jgi:transcriptional regulator with XRE-family HTH domain
VVSLELMPIGRRLKVLREIAGMSQQSLAVSAGLSVSLVSQIERRSRVDPRMSTITALARALGVSLDELVGKIDLASDREKMPKPAGRPRR